jgi:hypothetical protein
MGLISLIFITSMSLSTMIARDIRLVDRAIKSEQARVMAEAGISHALGRLKSEGFASRSSFFENMVTGSYSVVFLEEGGRHLVESTGTVAAVSVVSSAEIVDNTPTAMNYITSAGNDVRIRAFVAGVVLNGDLHANHNVELYSGPLVAFLYVTGNVYAGNDVIEGATQYVDDTYDNHVYINGVNNDSATIYEDQPNITFPILDLAVYKQAAIDSGNYTNGNLDVTDRTFTPANGIVYVDGDLTLRGTCTLNGGVIANNIYINGTLIQKEAGSRNVIYAKNGDVRVFGRLTVAKALIYASQDIRGLQAAAILDINGVMAAKRDIKMWDFLVYITYDYTPVAPADMFREDGDDMFKLVSWNQ